MIGIQDINSYIVDEDRHIQLFDLLQPLLEVVLLAWPLIIGNEGSDLDVRVDVVDFSPSEIEFELVSGG